MNAINQQLKGTGLSARVFEDEDVFELAADPHALPNSMRLRIKPGTDGTPVANIALPSGLTLTIGAVDGDVTRVSLPGGFFFESDTRSPDAVRLLLPGQSAPSIVVIRNQSSGGVGSD